MTLVTSGRASGLRCHVCGSPDSACSGAHAQTEVVAFDIPEKGAPRMPVDVIVRRLINGSMATVLGNAEEAAREGWEIVSGLDGQPPPKPGHKKREAPEPVKPSAPEPVKPETEDAPDPDHERRAVLEAKTKADVYDLAADLDIAGRSGMDKGQLVDAVLEAEAAAG